MSDNGQQAPLIERLRSVPAAARVLEHTPNPLGYDTASIPGGALCREAAERIAELEAELARVREDRDALRRVLNRLPPYDADGFYIDHGEHGKQPVSVADVMDSLRGAVLALDAARGKEQK